VTCIVSTRNTFRTGRDGTVGGYGLHIVSAFAARWGTGREDERNNTWFELNLLAPATA
jgi:hypothetical protein